MPLGLKGIALCLFLNKIITIFDTKDGVTQWQRLISLS
jgi:hypothetical protein